MNAFALAGAACSFAGARSPEQLWTNVLAQRAAFRAIPPQRLDLRAYAETGDPAESIACRVAALVTGYAFPRERYRIPASTYRQVDLVHWLALDVAAQAVHDAERRTGALPRERTAVVVANTLTGEMSRANALRHRWPYVRRVVADVLRARPGPDDADVLLAAIEQKFKAPFEPVADEGLAGALSNTIAGRICNYFDFGGGGHVVDGACASSLVAVANACAALEAGDVDAVIAGAVDVSLDPFELIGFSRLGALATDAMCVYGRGATGFLPGEGAAFVVIVRDCARPLALIRGWGLSSDGAGAITRPEFDGQLRALRRAYERAGCDPRDVPYFEGHGTGTEVGDDVELRALHALRDGPVAAPPAYVGSVKTLIGHTKAAAGMAGLLKAALAVRREIIPPHVLQGAQHPALGASLQVTRRGLPWPADRPAMCGVSAFGFGGLNAHVVLERAGPRRGFALGRREQRLLRSPQDAELVLLGAADRGALVRKLHETASALAGMSAAELTDFAVRSAREADDHPHRAGFLIARPWTAPDGLAPLIAALEGGAQTYAANDAWYGSERVKPRIALLFPGQAAPVRRDAGVYGRRFAQLDSTSAAVPPGDPGSTAVAQPALVASALAGLDALRLIGIGGDVAVGHSLGELVALHWAGAFDRDVLTALAVRRGLAMQSHCARGAMASVAAPAAAVLAALRGECAIACRNGAERYVIGGTQADVEATIAAARAAGYVCSPLPVTTAFHSAAMAPARVPFRKDLAAASIGMPVRPVVSTVHGRLWQPGDDVRETLERQLVEPVRFAEALAALGDIQFAVEVGAGETLRALTAGALGVPVFSLDVGGDSFRGLLSLCGLLYAQTGDASAARALAGERFACEPVLDAQRTVFANPCGSEHGAQTPPESESWAPAAVPVAAARAARAAPDAPALNVVRELLAQRAELPVETIEAKTRLLEHLHLSSLAVGQVLADLAAALDVEPPDDPLQYATASAGEIAEAFEELRTAGRRRAPPRQIAGVAPWVRRFSVAAVLAPPARDAMAETLDWRYRSNAADEVDTALRALLTPADAGARACALYLIDAPPHELAAELLRWANDDLADAAATTALLVVRGAAGASFARTLALERHDLRVRLTIVEGAVPPAHALVPVLDDVRYRETVVRDGTVLRPVLRPAPGATEQCEPLHRGDVLLVTGGGKGIGAECAFARAVESGAGLVVVGRASPERDAELAANLARFQRAGIPFRYASADVRDAAALASAVAAAERALGPVTAILHAAGVNDPTAIAHLTRDRIAETIAIKVDGLVNAVAACDTRRLREVVAFGSVIARSGMPGEAHYALANELLVRCAGRLAAAHPACRWLVPEWSIWSGAGMGERLGRVDALARDGIAAIPADLGVAAYLELVRDPSACGPIVLSARLAGLPTLEFERVPLPLARFLERTLIDVPGVELVADAQLDCGTDPYLDDHRIDGLAVVPGVFLIEAMMQAAAALLGEAPRELRDLTFARPVVLGTDGRRTVRVAALREGATVRVEIRTDESAFGFAHASASAHRAASPPTATRVERAAAQDALPLAAELYDSILFHRGRFARIGRYEALCATRCRAVTAAQPERAPFAPAFAQALIWGDPFVRDAAIHALQACVPEARVLPASIARITRHAVEFPPEVTVHGIEAGRTADTYTFDVLVAGADGTPLETIHGLVLRRSAARSPKQPIPPSLLATAIERRLLDAGCELNVRVFVPPSLERWEARPNGRPVADGISRCYARELELQCSARTAIGIDAEFAGDVTSEAWAAVTAAHREAARCAHDLNDEPLQRAQSRVWCALEAAKKVEGVTPRALSVRAVYADGVVVFGTGRTGVTTIAVATALAADPLIVAVALPLRATAGGGIAS